MSTQRKRETTKAEECMRALMMTAKTLRRFGESRFAEHPQFSKLSGPRVGVLFAVQAAGAMRMGDLAAKLQVAPRTVTDLIDGLERDGFLRRIPDPKDRRATLIELTPEIKDEWDNIAKIRMQFLTELFSELSVEEQDEMVRLLTKLRKKAREHFGGGECNLHE